MTLTTFKDASLHDDFIDIKYRELTPTINQIFQICEADNAILLCEKDGAACRVDLHDVLYIEWVDNKSYVYTKNDVYVLASPLVQLEESLQDRQFTRISKTCLVNLYKIKSVSNGLNMRLTAEIVNGERVIISRHYRSGLLSEIHKLARRIAK